MLFCRVLATVVACGSEDAPPGRFRFSAISWDDVPLAGLVIEVDGGSATASISGAEFLVTADYAQPHTPWTETHGEGALKMRFTLWIADEIVSTGDIELELRDDWAWEIQFHVATDDPIDRCFGCAGSRGFPLENDRTRQLFVVWGGNSISDPVVY